MIWLYLLLLNPQGTVDKLTYESYGSFDSCTAAAAKHQKQWDAEDDGERAGRQLVTVCLYNDPKSIGAQVRENPPTSN